MNARREQPLSQIAMSVTDLRRTHQWYQDVLGFVPAGGTELFKGWAAERVQGVPGSNSTCWWLVDRQDFFQLELFEFHRPRVRPLPKDWRPCDIGYTTVGIHVTDLDAVLARARLHGSTPLAAPLGETGRRRVCLRDPEGVLLELMEEDIRAPAPRQRPRPDVSAVVRSVTASVPDLEASRRFFMEGIGLPEAESVTLHTPAHERLWGLDGARRDTALLWADDILLELVQYTDPVGKPWPPSYYISDQGLLNIAFGYRGRRQLSAALKRARAAGATPNWRVLDLANWGVVYVNDAQGFSVELLYVRPYWDGHMGFLPGRPDLATEQKLTIRAEPEAVWTRLVDHARMGEWWPDVHSELVTPGENTNGPGAVRHLRSGRQVLVEEVVAWEPGVRLDYRLRSGAPLSYHFGRVTLRPLGDGSTELHYVIRFAPKIPGTG